MNAPGKGLLKVSGILLIIAGGFWLLLGVLAALGMLVPGVLAASAQATNTTVTMVVVGAIVIVVLGAIYLIAGILGVKNCNKPEKAQVCFTISIIMLLVIILDSISSLMGGTLKWYNIIIGLVLPVVYLLGALKNKEVASTGVIDQAEDAVADTVEDDK